MFCAVTFKDLLILLNYIFDPMNLVRYSQKHLFVTGKGLSCSHENLRLENLVVTLQNLWKRYFVAKIVLTYCEKKKLLIEKKLLKFETGGKEFENFLRSLEQSIQNNRTIFGNRMLVPGSFSYLINQNNYNSNWKKKWDLETCRKSQKMVYFILHLVQRTF